MHYKNIPEEELKTRIGKDYFFDYDCTKIIGKVDFCCAFFCKLYLTLDCKHYLENTRKVILFVP